jgi:hypothetical protein
MRGPFARVSAPGSCVNVRTTPGVSSESLDCAADGVLLADLGDTGDADGQTWRRVRTPAGVEGWAADQYLEHE